MSVAHITKDDFQKEVLDADKLVLVDFFAEWCGPCKMVAPIIEELSGEMDNVKFVKVNVDENQELAGSYSVFSIPTFIMFKDGKIVSQFVGAKGKEGFKEELAKHV